MSVDWPVPRLPLCDRLVAVTFALPCGCDQVAFQPLPTRWLPGQVKVSVQPVSGSPRLLIRRPAVKPLPQSLTV
jgi:hypothetical protein